MSQYIVVQDLKEYDKNISYSLRSVVNSSGNDKLTFMSIGRPIIAGSAGKGYTLKDEPAHAVSVNDLIEYVDAFEHDKDRKKHYGHYGMNNVRKLISLLDNPSISETITTTDPVRYRYHNDDYRVKMQVVLLPGHKDRSWRGKKLIEFGMLIYNKKIRSSAWRRYFVCYQYDKVTYWMYDTTLGKFTPTDPVPDTAAHIYNGMHIYNYVTVERINNG